MYKILITGGAGFIGAHLARNLQKKNSIMIVDNLENTGGISYVDKSNFFVKGSILEQKILIIILGPQMRFTIKKPPEYEASFEGDGHKSLNKLDHRSSLLVCGVVDNGLVCCGGCLTTWLAIEPPFRSLQPPPLPP